MFLQILSIIALCACAAIAWKWGGTDERITAFGFVVAALITPFFFQGRYDHPEFGVLMVDAAVLVGLVILALRSDRFWPLWAAAFQLVGTTVHMGAMTETGDFAKAYANAVLFWFYPVVISLMVGTWLEARKRQTW